MKIRSLTHIGFMATIAVKGFYGVIETLLGILIAVTGQDGFYSLVLHLTAPELEAETVSRPIAALQQGAMSLSQASAVFVIFYLLTHGGLKVAIAINLLQEKRWAFAPACVILSAFALYMFYEVTQHFSPWLLCFAIFDTITVALVINEWIALERKAKASRPAPP